MPNFRPVKQSAKQKTKKNGSAQQVFETADDWQDAAEAAEQTGGKHRAGDPKKSARAFASAIDLYENGLAQFPDDGDLAFNQARLLADLSQQPIIVASFPDAFTLETFQRRALASCNRALTLAPHESMAWFNSAQVLTSLAETLVDVNPVPSHDSEAIAMLLEALGMFRTCLDMQHSSFEQQQELERTMRAQNGDVQPDAVGQPSIHAMQGSSAQANVLGQTALGQVVETTQELKLMLQQVLNETSSSQSHTPADVLSIKQTAVMHPITRARDIQTVTVQSPPTVSDVLDTIQAMMYTLRQLVGTDLRSREFAEFSALSSILSSKLGHYVSLLDVDSLEAASSELTIELTRLNLAVAAHCYKSGRLPVEVYARMLQPILTMQTFTSLCAYADEAMHIVEIVRSLAGSSQQDVSPKDLVQFLHAMLDECDRYYNAAMQAVKPLETERISKLAYVNAALGQVNLARYHVLAAQHGQQKLDVDTQGLMLRVLENARQQCVLAAGGYRQCLDGREAVECDMLALVCDYATAQIDGQQSTAMTQIGTRIMNGPQSGIDALREVQSLVQ